MVNIFESLFGKKEVKVIENMTENVVSAINPIEQMTPSEKKELSKEILSWTNSVVYVLLFATPLLALPLVADWFDLPKQTFILIVSLAGMFLWSLSGILSKKLAFVSSIFALPIAAFAVSSIISALLSVNKLPSLASDPVLVVGGATLFFLVSTIINKEKSIDTAVKVILASGAVLGGWAVISQTLALSATMGKFTINILPLSPNFSLSGSLMTQAFFLAALLPLAIGLYVKTQKDKSSLLPVVLMSLTAAGLVASLYGLYVNRPILVDHATSWKVATSALGESLTSAFFGATPGHYVDYFTSYKPAAFNSAPYWNLKFSTSSNYYFYVLTTLGIAGLACLLFLVARFAMMAKKRLESGIASPLEKGMLGSIALILIGFIFLPAPVVLVFTMFSLLGLLVSFYRSKDITIYAVSREALFANFPLLNYGAFAAVVALLVGSGYLLGRFLIADYFFAQSAQAAAENRGTDAYNNQIQALTFNPWNVNYRINYSQINLALADSLAGQANLSDQQKQTVIALVQQAIREGRIAVSLEPKRSAAWENLSLIYRNLINFAAGADEWAVATQNQAINFDPTNPRLRLDLGGIFFGAKNYQVAAQFFSQATSLKPDYANAHYNLAQAMKQIGSNDQARQELQLVATLVCQAEFGRNSEDCKRVNEEIASLPTGNQPAVAGAATESAKPAPEVKPAEEEQSPLATPEAEKKNLPKARTQPPARISSPSGEITR